MGPLALALYRVGLELLVLNGALTFAGLWLVSWRRASR
jgi:hypothetical protein